MKQTTTIMIRVKQIYQMNLKYLSKLCYIIFVIFIYILLGFTNLSQIMIWKVVRKADHVFPVLSRSCMTKIFIFQYTVIYIDYKKSPEHYLTLEFVVKEFFEHEK